MTSTLFYLFIATLNGFSSVYSTAVFRPQDDVQPALKKETIQEIRKAQTQVNIRIFYLVKRHDSS